MTQDRSATVTAASTTAIADEPALRLVGIGKSFGGSPALTDVSLTVRRGEVHALLGENGAGKSTLMNVASGALTPDVGEIIVSGQSYAGLTPSQALGLGISIVHQHPAVLPDLTVLENLKVSLPRSVFAGGSARDRAQALIDRVSLKAHLDDRVEYLSISEKHLLEIAKGLAVNPSVLVLDEPTAALGSESVERLFALMASATAEGTAVVYITHRMAEVREVATRVTVLRDGHVARADAALDDVSDDDLLALIVGRRLDSTFPPKNAAKDPEQNLAIDGLSGSGFADISVSGLRGEIIGIAGVVGNGQAGLVRALAGLQPHTGRISIQGNEQSASELLKDAAYLPADRHHEGLIMTFGVRENAALGALSRFLKGPFLSGKKETELVAAGLRQLSVKARGLDVPVSTLSGGNQQKVVMARTVLSGPRLVVAEEPTQGVDVGARAEIYGILREISTAGTPVIVSSSDAKELEGLCDRVVVMSRGRAVSHLIGDEITEERMVHDAVATRTASISVATDDARTSRFSRALRGDYPPSLLILGVMIVLGGFVLSQNHNYLNAFNLNSMMMSATALGFIALGQTISLLIGGIDLSVGPLAGLLVVISSFYFTDGSATGSLLLGIATMVLVTLAVGLINGALIRFAKFTAIAATLATYIALQGVSFILRPTPEGQIDTAVLDALATSAGPVPLVFVLLVAITVGLEIALRRTRWGLRLRAAGSEEANAIRVGVNVNRTVIGAYLLTSLLTLLGAFILMQQVGVGDPAQGVSYTLTSIAAVVLGGTSVFGGRGSFLGTLLGAALLVQVLNATVFLRLDQLWQYVLQGLLIILAMIGYRLLRGRRNNATAA